MSYKHLTINERNKIAVLSKEGYSSRRIANTVCKDIVCIKTIYNWIYSGINDLVQYIFLLL